MIKEVHCAPQFIKIIDLQEKLLLHHFDKNKKGNNIMRENKLCRGSAMNNANKQPRLCLETFRGPTVSKAVVVD